jgi:hypothetical protein
MGTSENKIIADIVAAKVSDVFVPQLALSGTAQLLW